MHNLRHSSKIGYMLLEDKEAFEHNTPSSNTDVVATKPSSSRGPCGVPHSNGEKKNNVCTSDAPLHAEIEDEILRHDITA